jgi:hypothetical protein
MEFTLSFKNKKISLCVFYRRLLQKNNQNGKVKFEFPPPPTVSNVSIGVMKAQETVHMKRRQLFRPSFMHIKSAQVATFTSRFHMKS